MKNIISKSFTTIALASISIFITIIVFYFGGIILGNILNPPHVHHYECVCDQPPVLTILEGAIWGVIYLIILIFGFNYILFKIDFNKSVSKVEATPWHTIVIRSKPIPVSTFFFSKGD